MLSACNLLQSRARDLQPEGAWELRQETISMRRDYRLYELTDHEFEMLVVRICVRWLQARASALLHPAVMAGGTELSMARPMSSRVGWPP